MPNIIKDAQSFKKYINDYGCQKWWKNIPGLRSKWFWFDAATAKSGGLYIFLSKKDFEAYQDSDTCKRLEKAPFCKNLKFEAHSALFCSEQRDGFNIWAKEKGSGFSHEDLQSARLLIYTAEISSIADPAHMGSMEVLPSKGSCNDTVWKRTGEKVRGALSRDMLDAKLALEECNGETCFKNMYLTIFEKAGAFWVSGFYIFDTEDAFQRF